ncbi:hypothetical protein FJZ18_04390 [Candidatus Pacearchaeota archaeon]|nr:hypothetical protein [Candidatus Pacearchaeota archaeon]
MDIISNLRKAGFTLNESEVYSILAELGESKTGRLCEKTGIPSSHIYEVLNSLVEKGVVSFKLYKNAKIYRINAPETLRNIFLSKKEELEKTEEEINIAIQSLKKVPKNNETISDYKYFEGIKGIKSMWLELNNLMEKGDNMDAYTGSVESFEDLTTFYLEEIHKQRVKKGISSKMILPIGAEKEAKLRKKIGKIECKFIEKQSEGEFIVHKDFVVLQHTAKSKNIPRGFLIKDSMFAGMFKEIFNQMWKVSKK